MSWFNSALQLFSHTLNAVAGEPALRFFLLLVPVLAAGSLVMSMIQQGRKGKL